MKSSPASLFQKVTAASFVLILSLFSACDLFNLSIPDYIEKNINTAEGTDFQFVTETNGKAGAFYLIKPNQATELDILLRNPQKFDLEPILEFLNGAGTWTGTNPLYNSDVYITARNTGDYSRIRITIGAGGGFPEPGTELPRMRLKLKNNELGRVYEPPYVLPLMKCANNPGGGGDPGDPLTPHIVAAVPVGTITDQKTQDFRIIWYPGSGGGEIVNVEIQFDTDVRVIPYTNGTWNGTDFYGDGNPSNPYNFNIHFDNSVWVGTPLTLMVNYAGTTLAFATENPENITELPVYVDQNGGAGSYFGINQDEPGKRANLAGVFDNVLSRYSDVKIIVSEPDSIIDDATSYIVASGKTVVIEPSSTGVGMTIKKSVSQGSLFTVENSGNLTIKGNEDGDKTLTLKGLSTNNAALITVSGELFMETGAVITENINTGSSGGGVNIGYNGKFTMRGGEIYNNTAVGGGGVYITAGLDGGGTFIMEGGIIGTTEGKVTDSGNKGNTATGNGGGVFIANGTFTMKGSSVIAQNKADNAAGGGGGVYVNRGTFEMVSGTIGGVSEDSDGNWTSGRGGGVCLISVDGQLIRGAEADITIAQNIAVADSNTNETFQP